MGHTSSLNLQPLESARPRWRRALPAPVRALGRPVVRAWQLLHGQWQSRARRAAEAAELDAATKSATPIIEDAYGYRFVLYDYDRPRLPLLVGHPYDTAEFRVIPRLLRPGSTALDVGANIGVYSVLLSRLCGPSGRVWAFEPVPDTCWRLRETLALNRCGNVVPVQAAICDRQGTVTMNLFDPVHAVWNSMGKPQLGPEGAKVAPHTSVNVPSLTLDAFCRKESITHVNLLKVDVEGFELSVFRGAEQLLREHRVDYVCFEISQEPLRAAGLTSRQVFMELEKWGYRVYELEQRGASFSGPVHDADTESFSNFFASAKDLTAI